MDPPTCDIESSSAKLRIEGVTDRVTEHDERKYGQGQEDAREDQHVRGRPDQTNPGRLRDLDTPGDGRRLQSDAQIGEAGFDGARRSVDVVAEGGISPYMEAGILRDAVPL